MVYGEWLAVSRMPWAVGRWPVQLTVDS